MCVAYCLFRGFGRSVDGGGPWRKGKGQVAPEDGGGTGADGWAGAGAGKGMAGNLAAAGAAGGVAAVIAVSWFGVGRWSGGGGSGQWEVRFRRAAMRCIDQAWGC